MPKLEQLRIELEKLRFHYLEHLPEKLSLVRRLWSEIKNAPDQALTLCQRANAHLHALEGSAATFGFSELSHSAGRLQAVLNRLGLGKVKPEHVADEVDVLLRQIDAHIAKPIGQEFHPIASAASSNRQELIYIADDDFFLAEHLRLQISCFGYRTQQFQRLEDLEKAVEEEVPAAFVLDIRFPGAELGGALVMERLQRKTQRRIPLIFISARTDQEARLHAIRAGSEAYFVKPVDINDLVDALDRATRPAIIDPYRVLLVEDSVALSSFYAQTLTQAGMEVCTVNEPMDLLGSMIEFGPEVVILDLYLPGWSGYELAAMLRQQETFVSLPIIFLSVERKLELQLKAMDCGADDFLTKPIDPHHLVASIRNRIQRYRVLRRYMVQDGLTGLYSHSRLKELMDIELTRAKRQISPAAFVMVDLDQFKAINDTHGHMAGDRVLKTLAKLFRQRLRRTDIVGRYGGEEFGLVMPDIDAKQACEVIDQLRETFSHIQHRGRHGVFTSTFSAGISAYPNGLTITDLCMAADKAMYKAKGKGRNCVVIAD